MSVVVEKNDFTRLLRVLNTNISGNEKVMVALTKIKGVGRRFATIVLKKAGVSLERRAGELSDEEVETIKTIIANPRQFDIPDWFLNRQKDPQTGKYSHVVANNVTSALREDWERMKKIRLHRGLRHWWGLRVRGQRTKTSGRHSAKTATLLRTIGIGS